MMMMFSRIAGSVSRSARSRLQSNRFSGVGAESWLEAKPCVNGGLGFATACLRSNGVGAGNQIVRRLFCTESPEKRNYDIYYYSSDPMKKKIIPRAQSEFDYDKMKSPKAAQGQNSESNGRVARENIQENWMLITFVACLCYLLPAHDNEYGAQISFQEFSNLLRERGLVDHIEVSMGYNKIAHVYVRSLPRTTERKKDDHPHRYEKSTTDKICRYKYYFKLESTINEFEKKLKEVQTSLGIEPQDFVPIVYKLEGNWGYYSHKYVW